MKMLPLHLLLYKMVVAFQPCETLAGFLLGKPLRVGGTLAVSPGKGSAKLGMLDITPPPDSLFMRGLKSKSRQVSDVRNDGGA